MWRQNVVWSGNYLSVNDSSDVRQPISRPTHIYAYDHWYWIPVEIVMGMLWSIQISHQPMKKLVTCSSSNIKGRRFQAYMVTRVFILLPHLYVYHTCTRALHMSSPVANRSIVDPGAKVQQNSARTRQMPSWWCTHYQGLILNRLLSRLLKQPTQNSCPSLVTFKPILMTYAAQKYGGEKTACKGAICMFSLIDCTEFCAREASSVIVSQTPDQDIMEKMRAIIAIKQSLRI